MFFVPPNIGANLILFRAHLLANSTFVKISNVERNWLKSSIQILFYLFTSSFNSLEIVLHWIKCWYIIGACANRCMQVCLTFSTDSTTVKNICRKNICCGTIFVSPFGEAMVDPRFLSPCQNQSKQNISEKFAKSLLSFENIVEKELKNMKTMKKKSTEDRCFSYSDQDEGFFDRSSSSPPYCDRGKRKIVN